MIEKTKAGLAAMLNVTEDEAYNLIRFGESRGLVRKLKTDASGSKYKGRGPAVYEIDDDFGEQIAILWQQGKDRAHAAADPVS